MATISMTVVAGAQNYTKSKTVSAADLTRLLAAYRLRSKNPALTDAQVADRFFDELFSYARRSVQATEQEFNVVAEIGMI